MAQSFPLFDLPAELRIRVYEHVFDVRNDNARLRYHQERYGTCDLESYPAGICKLDLSARGTVKSCSLGEARLQTSPMRCFTAILRTCKQVVREATDVLFAQTCFRIFCGASHTSGSRLLCASRSTCFNFKHTSIYDRSMIQLLGHAQNAELSMRFEREGQILDLLPAVDVLLSILNLNRKQKLRTFHITLAEWLPFCLDTIDPWTWHDIIDALRGMTFACTPVIEVKPIPAEGDEKYTRLKQITDATGGMIAEESLAMWMERKRLRSLDLPGDFGKEREAGDEDRRLGTYRLAPDCCFGKAQTSSEDEHQSTFAMAARPDVQAILDAAHISPEIFTLRPDYRALLLIVDGITSEPSNVFSDSKLQEAEASARSALAEKPVTELPHIASWREAYKAFGAKPNKFRNSLEALTRRAEKGLPRVNWLTDIYNAVSVKHQIPLGGEDLTKYIGSPHLKRATGEEKFEVNADGKIVNELVDKGEVVWCDDEDVTCRRWNWRQGPRTALSTETTSALFILDGLNPLTDRQMEAAGDDLVEALQRNCPGAVNVRRMMKA